MSLSRREFVRVAGAACLTPALPGFSRGDSAGASIARWPGYGGATVVDGLGGPLQFNIPQGGLPLTAEDLARVAESGITALNLTVGVVGSSAPDPFRTTVDRIAAWDQELTRSSTALRGVRTLADLRDAKATGRLGIIYGFQDAVPLEGRIERLALFHEMGVRVIQLTYNDRNRLGSGCLDPRDGGLSDFGHEVVGSMEEMGILVDLSHCGARTTREAVEASTRPPSITHSGCSAIHPHPRNKDDETLRALADRGGVMGIYLMPFLNASGPPTAEDVLAHLDHALDVCGEDHVGMGSDQGIVPLDVGGDFPARFHAESQRRSAAGIAAPREDTIPYVPDLNHPRRMETIADLMSARGHSDRVVEKVLGANWARLLGEVWR
ncbi:MAG: dipeptidase [Gemmatimonadota bacterium]|nr:dipeptidase [Gemmatimonadota bacterium]MDH5759695.1 dipeptidase [Gemmatimonadota bacterium]